MKYKKIDPEESLEKLRTDLAEYNFILEQQLKKKFLTTKRSAVKMWNTSTILPSKIAKSKTWLSVLSLKKERKDFSYFIYFNQLYNYEYLFIFPF